MDGFRHFHHSACERVPEDRHGAGETEALFGAGAVIGMGESYCLQNRLLSSADQFLRGDGRAAEFVALKRRADLGLRFMNALWDTYRARI